MQKSTKTISIHIAKFLFAFGALYYLFTTSLLDFGIILQIIYDIGFIAKILGIVTLILVLGNLKWFILLKSQKIKITFSNCFYLYYIGYAFNYFLPGGIAGDAVKIGYIAKRNNKRSIAAMSIIIDRGLGLLAMMLVILFFAPFIISKINKLKWIVIDNPNLATPYLITISVLSILFFIITFSFVNNKKLYKKLIGLFKKRKNKINKIFLKIIGAVFAYRKSGPTIILNVLIAVIIQVIIAFCLLLIGEKILNFNIGIFSYNLASIISQIISIIPLSPGGIGVGEVSFAKILYYLHDRILLGYASIYFTFRMLNILCCTPVILLFAFGQKKLQEH